MAEHIGGMHRVGHKIRLNEHDKRNENKKKW